MAQVFKTKTAQIVTIVKILALKGLRQSYNIIKLCKK